MRIFDSDNSRVNYSGHFNLLLTYLTLLIVTEVKEFSVDQSASLTFFRLAQELKQIQAHAAKHDLILTSEKLKESQEKVRIETQKLEINIQQRGMAQIQREQTLKQ